MTSFNFTLTLANGVVTGISGSHVNMLWDELREIKCKDETIEFDCSENRLSKIPPDVLPHKLIKLYCHKNPRLSKLPTILPENLSEIICHSNALIKLPPVLPPHVTVLNCHDNKLTKLPPTIHTLSTMTYLNCSYNQISRLPDLPPSLTYLNCSCNRLTKLPDLPHSLIMLHCHSNELEEFPFILSLMIKEIHCWDNKLNKLSQILPPELTVLNCHGNKLIELPELPSSLIELDFSINRLTTIPPSLYSCKKLKRCQYWCNDLNYRSPEFARFILYLRHINCVKDLLISPVYTYIFSVNEMDVKDSVRKSIQSILRTTKKEVFRIEEVMQDNILEFETKINIANLCRNKIVCSTYDVSFEDVFKPIWTRIRRNFHIKRIVDEDMRINMKSVIPCCLSGTIATIVNALSGFYDDISINLKNSEQIWNVIQLTRNKIIREEGSYDAGKHRDLAKQELYEREYDSQTVEDWMTAIIDYQ